MDKSISNNNFKEINWKRIKDADRVEDSMPNCKEKEYFEECLELYKHNLFFCTTYLAQLKEIKKKGKDFREIHEFSIAFWSTTIYAIQSTMITLLSSFLSNDDRSLKKTMPYIINNQDKIFTKKFLSTWESELGEINECEFVERTQLSKELDRCNKIINDAQTIYEKISKARNKVYCHFDKMTVNMDLLNDEILHKIMNDDLDAYIKMIGEVVRILNARYTRIDCGTECMNNKDITNIFYIIESHNKKHKQAN